MLWIIIWVAVSMLVMYPYAEQIQNLPRAEDKILSCIVFAVGGPVILLAGVITWALEIIGIDLEE